MLGAVQTITHELGWFGLCCPHDMPHHEALRIPSNWPAFWALLYEVKKEIFPLMPTVSTSLSASRNSRDVYADLEGSGVSSAFNAASKLVTVSIDCTILSQ